MAVAWVNNAFSASGATDGTTSAFGFVPANTFNVGDTAMFFVENGSVDVSVSSVTDGSNTYVVTNISTGLDIVYCLSITANPTTVTVHYPSAPGTGNFIFIEGDQFSGVVSIDPQIKGVSNNSGVNPVTSGNFTPATSNNMIYGITDVSATTVSAGTNVAFTLRSNGSSSGGNTTGISTETFLQGAAAAVAVTFGDSPASSFSSTVFWMALSPVSQPSGTKGLPTLPILGIGGLLAAARRLIRNARQTRREFLTTWRRLWGIYESGWRRSAEI